MKASMLKSVVSLALAGCFGFAAMPAAAQSPISDYFRVFDSTGGIAFEVSVTEALEDPNVIYYIPVNALPSGTSLIDPSMFGQATNVWEDFIGGSPSDIFGLATSVNPGDCPADGICLAFNSDTETFPPAFFGAGTFDVVEAGNPSGIWDATKYLNPVLVRDGWRAEFFSDVDEQVNPTPEPGSLALLGIGAAALGALRRKTKAQA